MKTACLLLVVGLVLVLTDRSSSFFWRRQRRIFNPCRIIACTHQKTREADRDGTVDGDVNSVKDDVSRDVLRLPEADHVV